MIEYDLAVTVPIPDDELASPVRALAYVDEQILYFATEAQIHRVHVDALGEGTPGE